MKYEFIKTNLKRFALKSMLKVLGVSRSGLWAALEADKILMAVTAMFCRW